MGYTVGKYKIVPPKPFPSMEKAVEYIQEKYPELDRETIEKHISPKVDENGKDKSTDSAEKNTDRKEHTPKGGTTGTKRVEPDINQPG